MTTIPFRGGQAPGLGLEGRVSCSGRKHLTFNDFRGPCLLASRPAVYEFVAATTSENRSIHQDQSQLSGLL